jgi:hypothetical protein
MRNLLFLSTALILLTSQAVVAQPAKPDDAKAKAVTPAGWTNGNPGSSKSQCPSGAYAVGVEVEGSSSGTKYCVGCVSRLRVLCQTLQ